MYPCTYLQVLVFTRISCIIYTSVMLVVLLRIQLNVIGGYLFKNPSEITSEFQQEYLMVCNKWLETGVPRLSTLIEKEVLKYYSKMLINLTVGPPLSLVPKNCWTSSTEEADKNFRPREYFLGYTECSARQSRKPY